jgi:hypothetical protein
METFATVVPDSGHNQNIVTFTQSNGARQQIIRLSS